MNDISYKIAEVMPTKTLSEAISLYNSECEAYFATLKKQESICAFLLLDEILGEHNVDKKTVIITRNMNRRPVVTDAVLDFSVSHSENVCACAVLFGKGKIGCDVQCKLKKSEQKLLQNARYFMSENELNAFYKSADKAAFYSLLWSQKEAFLKAHGKGTDSDLREIDISRVQILKDIYKCNDRLYYMSICSNI